MLRGGRESRRRREGEKRDEDDPLRGGGETAQLACLFGNGPHPSLPPPLGHSFRSLPSPSFSGLLRGQASLL